MSDTIETHTAPDFDDLMARAQEILGRDAARDDKLQAVCALLDEGVVHYNWVGFYLVDPEAEQALVLGPYVGAPTEHTRIAFGRGICGQAAATEQTFIVQDVSQETNYLSCSPDVLSEIVIPIMKDGEVLGELDIDSHTLAPFTPQDRAFLEQLADAIAPLL